MCSIDNLPNVHRTIFDKDLFDEVFKDMPVGVVSLNTKGEFIRMNPRNIEIFGLDGQPEESNICIFNDFEISSDIIEKLRRDDDVSFGRVLFSRNSSSNGKNSKEKYIYCRFRKVYDDAGEHLGYLIVNVDVTDPQNDLRNETLALSRQLQQVHHSANMMTWRWELNTGKIVSNRSFAPAEYSEHMNGLLNSNVTEIINCCIPEDRHIFLDYYEKLIQKQVDTAEIDVRFNFSGTQYGYLWVHFSGVVSEFDENGKPLVMVGSTTIIEERKRLEEELRKAKEKAEASDRLKTNFIEQTNHEIRTPLNAIVGYADILANCCQSLKEDELQEIVKQIRTNSSLMLELVSNMLYASQLQSGILTRRNDAFSLLDLFERLHAKYSNRVVPGVILKLYNNDGEDCVYYGDQRLLEVVFDNLLSNATKFTAQGTISFGFYDQNDKVRFVVSDTGPGLPEDKRLFEMFAKGSPFRQGMGLGLHLCQNLVNFLGGNLHVDSQPGKGATFCFTLDKISVCK